MMDFMEQVRGGGRGGFDRGWSPRIPAERYRLKKAFREDLAKGNVQKVKAALADMGYEKQDIKNIIDRYTELGRKEAKKGRDASRTRSASPRSPPRPSAT